MCRDEFLMVCYHYGDVREPLKSGFHIIITIVWIAVKDSSDLIDPSNLLEEFTNDFDDCEDQDRWDRTCFILYY